VDVKRKKKKKKEHLVIQYTHRVVTYSSNPSLVDTDSVTVTETKTQYLDQNKRLKIKERKEKKEHFLPVEGAVFSYVSAASQLLESREYKRQIELWNRKAHETCTFVWFTQTLFAGMLATASVLLFSHSFVFK
jgi:hypothetical protein